MGYLVLPQAPGSATVANDFAALACPSGLRAKRFSIELSTE
jgi:hypothetical protein